MDRDRWFQLARTASVLAFWYCISSGIILLTKWLFQSRFDFPLIVTTFSNSLTTLWAFLLSRHPNFTPKPLPRSQFFKFVLPIGIATALEIGFSNYALSILTVTFGTILKGASPIFTMLWGLLLRIELFSGKVSLALLTIALGIALASLSEGHDFKLLGFIFQILAVAFGGLRWAMTHVLLSGGAGQSMSPVTAILYTSPATAICVLPFALFFEWRPAMQHIEQEMDLTQHWVTIIIMTCIATLVFILLISEYWLVKATSSLALSVAGIFKELLTIFGGVLFFKDELSFMKVFGFCVCQVGIGSYVWLRYDPRADDHGRNGDSTEQEVAMIPLRNFEISDYEDEQMGTELTSAVVK